jgi:hypothetical protein
MGPAGAYLLAGLFKAFGASSLTLGAFSWIMSVLFLLGTVLLAYRLFGIDNALVVAGLFLVPIDWVMYLAGQPRAHYTIIFALPRDAGAAARHRGAGCRGCRVRPRPLQRLLLWTNMAIGPAIAVSLLLLLLHLRRAFFTAVLAPWVVGWVVGFGPVIWYNLTSRVAIAGQVDAENTFASGGFCRSRPTPGRASGGRLRHVPWRAAFVAVLVWVGLSTSGRCCGARRWRRGEDALGYQLVFGYFFLHLAVTMVPHGAASKPGRRSPMSVRCSPWLLHSALVLQSRLPRAGKVAALPSRC